METKRGMVRTIFAGCTVKTHMLLTMIIMYILLFCFHLPICSAKDALTLNECISDKQNETLISAGERFELGFFEGSGSKRFVGIWYYRSKLRTVVWVGNRDKALDDNTWSFCIGEHGKLVIASENNEIPLTKATGRMVKLFDSGNLVLSIEDDSKGFVWQSFLNPTDTFLPGMKMDERLKLISWKSHDDPAPGDYTFQMDLKGENQYSIYKGGRIPPYWKSGLSGSLIDDDIPSGVSYLFFNLTRSGSRTEDFEACYHKLKCIETSSALNYSRNNTRLVMSFTGEVQYFSRQVESARWRLNWKEPRDNCSVFRACGAYAVCNSDSNVLCKCLRGFEPTSVESWSSGDFSHGCRRKTPLLCNEDDKGNFSRLENMKLGMPDTNFVVEGENECRTECLKECCPVYSFQNETTKIRDRRGNATCWIWSENLYNIRKEYTDGGYDILLRLQDETELGSTKQAGDSYGGKKLETLLIAAVTIPIMTVLASIIAYVYLQKKEANRQDRQENRARTLALQLYDSQRHVEDLINSGRFKEEDKKGIDLPFFDFGSILAATDNFSEANQLGKGGFGPVYKGKFLGDRNIAVKRLSSVSQQGLDEFKNEVLLIARLQHRNLVSLLGYCIEGGEKILLYEYMPNKSLDFFIFDRTLSMLLDWEMRFNIILGIARGLLYLHQDSRLRIIHRDLKTSNILLDHEMNPKISDFGLAKIFDGKETRGTTGRVVGTYGYMSPEYALDGFFSVKSDVFSFGVVVLEIISGKKNTGFYNSEEALSLLGYAWRLWGEDRALDLVDQKLRESSKKSEILRCINVGLLCVQEDPDDRPSMSNVIIMLGGETVTLPIPKRPAFVIRRGLSGTASSSSKLESNIEITATLEGR